MLEKLRCENWYVSYILSLITVMVPTFTILSNLLMDSKFLKIQSEQPSPKLLNMSNYLALSNL